jgi:hypothetical protein
MSVLEYPISTSANSASITTGFIPSGVLKEVQLLFPAGCNGLVQVRISINGIQIMPMNYNQYSSGDGETISVPMETPLSTHSEVKINITNTDTYYPHEIIVRLMLLEKQLALTDSAVLYDEYITNQINLGVQNKSGGSAQRSFWDKIIDSVLRGLRG